LGFIFGLAAAAGLLVPASAAGSPAVKTVKLSLIQAAQLLIDAGKLDPAKTLLENQIKVKPDDSEALFLLGLIAVAEKDYDGAIDDFRRILVGQPDAQRVRLELARAFFLKGDYDNARIQFLRARAGDVPDTVKANIDRYLTAINRGKEWSYHFSLALAPDTNENAATNVNQVNLYGLPFTLSSTARQKSGIGVTGAVGGEYSPLIAYNIKALIGMDAYRTDYGGGQFDDMTVSAYAGPQFLFGNWDFSTLATAFNRWYGNRPYVRGTGGRLNADYGIAASWQIAASFGGQYLDYKTDPLESGPLYSVQAQIGHALSPSSALQFQFGFNRQDANPSFSYDGWWLGMGYQQDLPFGFSSNVQPSFFSTQYDAALAGFGVTRHDQAIMLHIGVLNRRFSYHGFTPEFSYTYTNQRSNIALYSYTRSQFQIGITSQF
jgi:hypothetical protein